MDRDYNARKFGEFVDQAAQIARDAAVFQPQDRALAEGVNRLRHLQHRAIARGMAHDQMDAIGRAFARSFVEAWSILESKRGLTS